MPSYYVTEPLLLLLLFTSATLACIWSRRPETPAATARERPRQASDAAAEEDNAHGTLLRWPRHQRFLPEEGRLPFAFLEDIHGRFVKTYGRAALTALAYSMNDEFSRVLSQQMDYYSNNPNADQISRMRGEIDQVRSVMLDNMDRVLGRGDRLELLVDKTANMQGNTMRFKRQARRFRNTMWWRNVKLTAASIFILVVIIYIVLAYVCHGFTLPSCVP